MEGKVFILNGYATCGKDTFAQLVASHTSVAHFSIVDPIRDIINQLPIGVYADLTRKDEKLRKLTSDLKLTLEEFSDYPYREVEGFLTGALKNYSCIFIDMREKQDIERLKKDYGAKLVFIENKRITPITSNIADAKIDKNSYDILIKNNGTLEELEEEAKRFIAQYV